MNPFNQTRFRGEHELGRAYMDIRRALDNLEAIKLVADNIKNLRSGNIELSADGSVLRWKYVNGEEWFDLVDLQQLTEDQDQAIDTINQTLQNFNTQLDNFNDIVSTRGAQIEDLETSTDALENSLTSLDSRIVAVEEYESRIDALENIVADLTTRIEALESPEEGGGV